MIYNHRYGFSNIEVVVLRATATTNGPIDDEHMHEILFLVSNSPGSIPFHASKSLAVFAKLETASSPSRPSSSSTASFSATTAASSNSYAALKFPAFLEGVTNTNVSFPSLLLRYRRSRSFHHLDEPELPSPSSEHKRDLANTGHFWRRGLWVFESTPSLVLLLLLLPVLRWVLSDSIFLYIG
jgi:hypothetical protein